MKNKKIIIILAVVIVAILLITFTLLFLNKVVTGQAETTTDKSESSESSLTERTHYAYCNGYEFSYLSPMIVVSYDDGKTLEISNESVSITLSYEPNSMENLKEANGDLTEKVINDTKIIYASKEENGVTYLEGYIKRDNSTSWKFSSKLSDNEADILKTLETVISNSEKLPNKQAIDIDNSRLLSFSIPEGFYRSHLNSMEDKYFIYSYYIDRESPNNFTNVNITYLDAAESDNKSIDEFIEDSIAQLNNSLKYGSFDTLDISDVNSIDVNGKYLKYIIADFSYDTEIGTSNHQRIIAYYQIDTGSTLKFEFSTNKSGITLDFETLKQFFDIKETFIAF